jgi:PHS family inorganic phosphate transporter-like MFS transporter
VQSPHSALQQLDESRLSRFHWKTVITSGMGFFTDAYDLFIIGVVIAILRPIWHPSALEISLLGSTALIAAAIGAVIFGRLADIFGRKSVYGYELLVLAAGAIASALSPNVIFLLVFRFILGLGVGGDYPVSATLMSEISNRHQRGKLITLVFSTQALGLIFGPLIAIVLLVSHVNLDITWRIMLALGAVPALSTFYLRRQIAESPRFALAHGNTTGMALTVAQAMQQAYSENTASAAFSPASNGTSTPSTNGSARDAMRGNGKYMAPAPVPARPPKPSWQRILTERHTLIWLLGTAGSWFMLDIAYYGTTVSTPIVLKLLNTSAALITNMVYTLLIFLIAALPGYIVAALTVDKLGRRKIQLLGFAMMCVSYGVLFVFPALTTITLAFLLVYGFSYFFTEFGPNVTTFVYPAEIFPVEIRTTAHGISAATGKIGAFIGAFLFPILLSSIHLPGAMGFAALISLLGLLLTFLLPEPDQKSLETIEQEGEHLDEDLAGKDASPISR